MTASPCPVPGCTAHQKPGKLMCLRHWRMVSAPTQAEVYRTWRAFSRAPASQHGETLRLLQPYRAARDKAIGEAASEAALHDGNPDLFRMAEAAKGLMP